MSAFLEGIGKVISKVTDHVQGRFERIKNEKIKLIDERHVLISNPLTERGANRLNAIDKRLSEINTTLGNKASD